MFLALGLLRLELLPPVTGVVETDGRDADADEIHRDGFLLLGLGARGAELALGDFLAARLGALEGLVHVVAGRDGGDSGEAAGQELLVAQFPRLFVFFF